jgi:hypothetical protein
MQVNNLTMEESLQLCGAFSESLRAELVANWNNRTVGSVLANEQERCFVWHLRVPPGGRVPFHRHENSYFWTALNPGRSRSHYHTGKVAETTYDAGLTRHFELEDGAFFIHDLENIGDTELVFVTVEFRT